MKNKKDEFQPLDLQALINDREELQKNADDFVKELSIEGRKKLPNIFWELFGDKYKP